MGGTSVRGYLIIFLSFFCLQTNYSCRQEGTLCKEESPADSVISLYRDTIYRNPLKALQVFDLTIRKATDSIDYYKLILFKGLCYLQNNVPDSTVLLYRSVLHFCKKQSPALSRLAELQAFACNYQGVFMQMNGKKDSAIFYLNEAYKALYRANDRTKLPDVCINLADNYAQDGNFPQATSYYRKALIIADSLDMGWEPKQAIYCGLAKIYTDLNNFSLADYYYRIAEQYYDSITPYERYYYANSRGYYYYITKNYPVALQWYYKANRATHKLAQQEAQAITESNLGETYLLMNQTDSAEYYLNKAANFFLTENANHSTRFYFNGLYASLALQKNNLAKAEKLLSVPFNAGEINPSYIYLHNKRLKEFYEKKGDYRKAYECIQKIEHYNDSIRNITALNNIAETDSRYRQDTILLKRDILIAKEKSRSLQWRNINILTVSLLLLVIMSVFIAFIYIKKRRNESYARQMAVITKLRMENIRNRISPHHIFNVLNAVIPTLRPYEQLAHPLQLLVQSIRKNLLISEKVATALEQETDFVKNYLELRKSTNSLKAKVRWKIAKEVNMQTMLPSMIIQIPVENAVKYAFEIESEDNLLLIEITEQNKELIINIQDNGIGFNPGEQADNINGTGTGLKILYRTIELLNSRNRTKIIFEIQNKSLIDPDTEGTLVHIVIPLNYNFNL